jgi:hypothetical protein
MKGYLSILGVAIIVISIVGGSFYLSGSYSTYQARLHALGVQPGSPITLSDEVKWQFAQILGGGIIFGGLVFGSILMGLGWIGKTMEQVRDALSGEGEQLSPREVMETSKSSEGLAR